MAIYHCSVKIIGRSSGRSSTGAAAYRAAEKIRDERSGEVHDYRRKGGVDHSQIIAPENAPAWVFDRSQLWNAVEQAEKRKDSQLSREVEVALPRELSLDQMRSLVSAYAQKQFVDRGMIADINIHHASGENPHAHIMLTTREITPDGFGKKNRSWNQKDLLEKWREHWQEHANNTLEQAGHDIRIDHRTLEAQGIERLPQIHLGAKVVEMEKRGVKTDRGARALEIEETNKKIVDLIKHREALEHEHNQLAKTGTESRGAGKRDRAIGPSHGDTVGRSTSNDLRNGDCERKTSRGLEQSPERGSQNRGKNTRTDATNFPENAGFSQINLGFSSTLDTAAMGNGSFGLNNTYASASDRILALARPNTVHQQARGDDASNPGLSENTDPARAIVKKQLLAMGSKLFEIGILARDNIMRLKTWSLNEVIKRVPWLQRENAKGSDIFIRPKDNHNPKALVVDNLDKSQINRLMKTGFEPSVIVEKTPENFTAWIRISDNAITPPAASQASLMLSRTVGGTPIREEWIRLAGFTNQRPEHTTHEGLSPMVTCHTALNRTASRGDFLIGITEDLLERKSIDKEKQERLKAIQGSPEGFYGRDAVMHYRMQLKRLTEDQGSSLDLSKADEIITKALAKKRYSKDELIEALNKASPEAVSRKMLEHDYAQRTVDRVFKDPEVKKGLQRSRRYDMGR